MAKNLFPEIEEDKTADGTMGSSQQILLFVLLFLVLVFGYLYFFTNLIRQREEVAKAPPGQTAQIRKPLPPRPDQGGEKPVATAKSVEKQPEQAKTEKPAPPPAPPQAKPVVVPPQPASAKAVKTEDKQLHKEQVKASPAPAQPAATPQKGGTKPVAAVTSATKKAPVPPQAKPAPLQAKPIAVPPQPASAKAVKTEDKQLHKEQVKASPAPAQPAATSQKGGTKLVAAVTSATKKVSASAESRQTAKPAVEKGNFTLLVGEFVVEREMKRTRTKLKSLGVTPVHGKKIEKLQIMHRLFLADFDSHYAADMELQKLAKVTSSAFILEQNGRYAVFAGSYLHEKGAAAEQKRLAGKGFKLSLKPAKVTIPINRVTAGSFSSSADARKESSRLEKQGIIARVIKIGK